MGIYVELTNTADANKIGFRTFWSRLNLTIVMAELRLEVRSFVADPLCPCWV
jgi:hypothetical protein